MTTNQIFRSITLGLQILAIAAYFLTPLFIGGNVGIGWLALGVIHTAIFCAIFFRNARRRTALSIVLMIFVILFSLIVFGFTMLFVANWTHITLFSPVILYSLSSLLAIIFALAFPRKLPEKAEELPEASEV